MQEITAPIVNFLNEYHEWAAVVVGLTAFCESLFIVGVLFPATPILLVVGGMFAAGTAEPAPVLAAAIFGAVTGDIVSYLIGKKSGRRITFSPVAKRHRTSIAKARVFFRKHGMLAVFMGRFFGPLRATVPFVAGMMHMEQAKFQAANIASAVIWAPVMLMPGWMAVEGYQFL